jgi:gliding motility-associated-like protein
VNHSLLKFLFVTTCLLFGNATNAQLFPGGDFEGGTGAGCACAANFTCGNDAGRVIDGTHPIFVVGNQGCISSVTNYSPQLGAYAGNGTIYFYAGADNYDAQPVNFVGGEEVCLSVWYTGPQGAGASGQNTANSHFSFKLDGVQIGPDVLVPVDTPWTEFTFTVIMTPGAHTFGILSGGAAQYSIWTDEFQANLCSAPCDAGWTPTTACSTDPVINLDLLITGNTGGTWAGTGVTGNSFDPSFGTQSITYTAPGACDSTQTITVTTTAVATWTPPLNLCTSSALIDLSTTITGTAGGTWSGTGVTGTMFDPSVGTQSITYTVGTTPCDDVSVQNITVSPSADATWTNPGPICQSDPAFNLDAFVTGTAGGTWSGTGVTGNMFDPTGLSGNITVSYTVGTAPCDATLALDINVITIANAGWTPPTTLCSSSPLFDLNTVITGTAGGTWSGTGVTGNMFDPSVGTQNITYTVGSGACQQTSMQTITIGTGGNPAWTTVTMCISDAPINLTGQVTGDPGGTWSGTGISGTVFDPFFGTQSITYTVGAAGCQQLSTQTITVLDPQLSTTAVNVSCFGLADGSATVNPTGVSGSQSYLWNPSGQTSQTATALGAGSYQVTVTDGSCTAVDSVTIVEPAEITAILTASNGCAPDKGTASVLASGGVGGFSYAWTPSGQTVSNAIDLDSAMHTVIVTDANGCTFTDSILVQIVPAPVILAMNDTTIIYPNCINLTATGGVAYTWTPVDDLDCSNCLSPEACPIIETNYCVTGTDINGCTNTDCVLINVEIICGDVFVPSAFSPNNDGENDLECVYSDCIKNMTFTIYNRWGEKVFETSDMNICWDGTWKGKELNSAVFVYILDGFLINGETVSQKGNISLIR